MQTIEEALDVWNGDGKTTQTPSRKPCPKCGRPDAVLSIRHACPACVQDYKRRQREFEERRRIDAIERLWRGSGLSDEWREKTFASFDRDVQPDAFDVCSDYADNFLTGQRKSLLLCGRVNGLGKTHLAVAIGNQVLTRYYRSVIFTTGGQLMRKLRATFSSHETSEYELLNALTAADLLILDDVGKEKYSEYVESIYYSVINDRYVAGKPMVLTSNTAWRDMGSHIGVAAVSRLTEVCKLLQMTGEDYRKKPNR